MPSSAVSRHLPDNRLIEPRLPPKDGRWQVRTFGIELLCAKVQMTPPGFMVQTYEGLAAQYNSDPKPVSRPQRNDGFRPYSLPARPL